MRILKRYYQLSRNSKVNSEQKIKCASLGQAKRTPFKHTTSISLLQIHYNILRPAIQSVFYERMLILWLKIFQLYFIQQKMLPGVWAAQYLQQGNYFIEQIFRRSKWVKISRCQNMPLKNGQVKRGCKYDFKLN